MRKALDVYRRNSVRRALIQAVPIAGAAADNFLLLKHDEMQRERISEFIAELDRQECDITHEKLERVDFCHATLVTVVAAARANRTEKVHLFARLLSNYDRLVSGSIEDDYEEMLRILDDISLREYHLLVILRNYEKMFVQEMEQMHPNGIPGGPRRWAGGHWDDFAWKDMKRLGVPEVEIAGVLVRLRRTGLYETMQGQESSSNFHGRTTPLFDHFQRAVERLEREHPVPPRSEMKDDREHPIAEHEEI
jgi:hypothetical protein